MKKRILSALVLAAMMLTTFASCSETATNETASAGTAADAAAADTAAAETSESSETEGGTSEAAEAETEEVSGIDAIVAAREAESDNLPEKDFGGKTYTVWESETGGDNSIDFATFIVSDGLNGELINDSVYYRNLAIEERFNAKVELYIPGDTGTTSDLIHNTVMAGDDAFQLASYHVVTNSGNALNGDYINWYDIPYIDFSRNWWSASNTEDLTINNVCLLAIGDFALSTVSQTYVMIYDKQTAEDKGVTDIYETVKDGKWTLAKLKEICEDVYTDTNGNGEADEGDFFGLSTDAFTNFDAYYWAFDNKMMTKDDNGDFVFSYYTEHLADCFSALREFYYGENVTDIIDDHAKGVTPGVAVLAEYRAMFANCYLSAAQMMLGDFDHDYGIIPYPKYDESQAEYRTMVDGNHEAMGVAKTASDLEFVGIITEALCAESYKRVVPNYLEVCLKQRYSSSAEDAEMIDLAINARVFDFGYIYDNRKGASFVFENVLPDNQDLASYCKSKEKLWSAYYKKCVRTFTDYAE